MNSEGNVILLSSAVHESGFAAFYGQIFFFTCAATAVFVSF